MELALPVFVNSEINDFCFSHFFVSYVMIFMHIYPYAVLYDYLPLAEVGIFSTEIKYFFTQTEPRYIQTAI